MKKIIITESQYKRLINEQESEIPAAKNTWYGEIVDTLLPGKPVEDMVNIYNKTADFYNSRGGKDPMSSEEIEWRKLLFHGTPDYGYGDIPTEWLSIGKNIKQGIKHAPWEGDVPLDINKQRELKAYFLGIEDHVLGSDRYFEVSDVKPSKSTNPNTKYLKPKDVENLTPDQFEILGNAVRSTKWKVGGNSMGVQAYIEDNYPEFPYNMNKTEYGTYTLGITPSGNISVYDLWDLRPILVKDFGADLNVFGTVPEIYYHYKKP